MFLGPLPLRECSLRIFSRVRKKRKKETKESFLILFQRIIKKERKERI
jgi:hypothetical protein